MISVARVFRCGASLRDWRKTLASEEASYNAAKNEHLGVTESVNRAE
jgi:hypothetical protein